MFYFYILLDYAKFSFIRKLHVEMFENLRGPRDRK